MKNFILVLVALLSIGVPTYAQEAPAPEKTAVVEVAQSGFRKVFIRAIQEERKEGNISTREAIALRVASFSPAFLKKAQDVAVIQIALSDGADDLPVTETGAIDVANIDWDALLEFIKALLPIILQILAALGV